MYSMLLVAALVVGSGDSRDGATDVGTENAPPYKKLRVGMSEKTVLRLMDGEEIDNGLLFWSRYAWRIGPDQCGRRRSVVVLFDEYSQISDIVIFTDRDKATPPEK
jgi:hypothetical protein